MVRAQLCMQLLHIEVLSTALQPQSKGIPTKRAYKYYTQQKVFKLFPMTSPSGNIQSMQPFYNSIPQQSSFYLPAIADEGAVDRNGYMLNPENICSNVRNYYGYQNPQQMNNFSTSTSMVSIPYAVQPIRQFESFSDCHQQMYEATDHNSADRMNNCGGSAFVDCNNMYNGFQHNNAQLNSMNTVYNVPLQSNIAYLNSDFSSVYSDSKQLEKFAERFKHRRIKLGVTQSEVGNQLQMLKIPGIGSLSQSTICRFESLTLSHNNMMALKPVLESWLHWAENDDSVNNPGIIRNDMMNRIGVNRKRKRTSIGNEEKRTLELYFTMHPRPNSERIAQIAEKLELKKSVVRVWFCNQRQKQKRMKCSSS